MPELPEVESVRQCLLNSTPSLINKQILRVLILRDSVVNGDHTQLTQAVTGAVCSDILRHGKYLFFGFHQSHAKRLNWFAVHLRMTGRLYLVHEQDMVQRHTRFALQLDQGYALRFDDPRAFGRVWLLDSPAAVTDTLGPDALQIDCTTFNRRLIGLKRQLKPLLLDQSFVAGIGNIYADEILFRAALHPKRHVDSLTSGELERLYRALHSVIEQAVALKGANIDGVFEAGSFPVAVYGRDGSPCVACGTLVMKERFGQRGTHFCPVCQPLV